MLKLLLSVLLAALLGAAAGFSYTVSIQYLTEIYTLPLLYVAGGVVAIYIVSLLLYTKNIISSFINIFLAGFIIIAIGYTALAYLIPVTETFPTLYKIDEADIINSQIMLNLLTYIIIAIGPIIANLPVGLVAAAPAKGKKGQKGKQPAKPVAKGGKAEPAKAGQPASVTAVPTKEKKEVESPLAKLFPTLFAKKEKAVKEVKADEKASQATPASTKDKKDSPGVLAKLFPTLFAKKDKKDKGEKHIETEADDIQGDFGSAAQSNAASAKLPELTRSYEAIDIVQKLSQIPAPALGNQQANISQPSQYQPQQQQQYYQPPQEMYQPPQPQYQPPQEMYQPPQPQYQPPQEMYQPPQPDYSRMSFPSSTSTVKMTAQDVHAMFDEISSTPTPAPTPASTVGPLKEVEFDSSFEGLFSAPEPQQQQPAQEQFNQNRFQEQPAPYSIPPQNYQPPVQDQFNTTQIQEPYNIQPNVTTPYQQQNFVDPNQFLPSQYQDNPVAPPAFGGYQQPQGFPAPQPPIPEPAPARPAPGGYQSPFAQPVESVAPQPPVGGYQSPFTQPPQGFLEVQPPVPEVQPPFVQPVENIAPSQPPVQQQPEPQGAQQDVAGNEKISAKVVGDASSGRMNPGKMLLDSDAINKIAGKDESRDMIHRTGLTSTRVISAAKGHTLDALLADINNIPGVHGSIIVGRDGLLIDSTIQDGTPKELIGAVGSSIYSNVEVATSRMQRGKMKQMFLNSDIGLTIVNELEGLGLLIVLTDLEAQNNLVELLGAIRTTIEVSKMVGGRK